MAASKKMLVVQAAALGHGLVAGAEEFAGLGFHAADSVFPAVTCTAQASFRTGAPPARHGMVANGRYWPALAKAMFWEQSAGLVEGERIWDDFREQGGTVGVMFWQQSLGEAADMVLSPAPIHKHHGGMIQDCYCQPADLYARLCKKVGGPFKLRHYWGPMASAKAGDWIAKATAAVLSEPDAPDLLLTYLPTLDYDLQRYGPTGPKAEAALAMLRAQLVPLLDACESQGREMLVFGDYAMGEVQGAAFPNRALRDAGLLAVRDVRGMQYADLHTSKAFAMVDHEIAHVYVRRPGDVPYVRAVLAECEGVGEVLGRAAQQRCGLDHPHSGDLVAVAAEGAWMAYPWWIGRKAAPDYATHVDIHNKPGYDPCELFFGWPPMSVSQDTRKIRGSHGRVGPGREIAWACTAPLAGEVGSLVDLAAALKRWVAEA